MMPELSIYDMEKKKVGTIDLPEALKEAGRVNLPLLHQTVVAQLSNRRQGNAKVKTRHEVSGSTRKIYRQKGTGRARHGDIKAPLFVGGGQAFGPKPKDYDMRLPQKERRAALQSAVLHRLQEGRLWVLDLDFKEPKTKAAAGLFSRFEIPAALVVLEGGNSAAEKSIRNLARFKACRIESLNVVDILRYEHLVMSRGAWEAISKRMGAKTGEG